MATNASADLLQPLRLGHRQARNRIVFAPHVTNLAEDGLPGERFLAYWERRAQGGAGLLILEECQVHLSSHPYQRALRGYDPAIVRAWRRLAEQVHAAGALVLAQLNHAGMQGTGHILKQVLWAPSAVANPGTQEMPKVMEPEDIAAVIEGFAHSAQLALEGGLDGVEINAGQNSLVRQFLSGLTNLRDDEWGGDEQGRLRFPREVVSAVRQAVGPEAVVGLRLCADELAPWAGIRPDQAPELAAALTKSGELDYVSVVAGSIYSQHATRAGLHQPPGYLLPLVASVRGRLGGLPVLASGSLVDPALASAAIAEGQADACEMTRALIADPDLPLKLAQGREAEIRPCIRCNQDCMVRGPANAIVSCIHNPEAGHEWEWPAILAAGRRRQVLVIGGGPAGLETARVAALRGHGVTLLERRPHLGGTAGLVAASGQRPTLGEVCRWLVDRLDGLKVNVRTDVEVTPKLVEELAPEVVVVATGAKARPPEGTLSAREVLDQGLPGEGRVVVVDFQGGYPAIDVALWAAERGHPVTILSPDPFVSSQLSASGELTPWYSTAAALGIQLRPLAWVAEVTSSGVHVRHRFGPQEEWLECEFVVWVDYEVPDDGLFRTLAGRDGLKVRRIGDCVAPRRILHAILEGGRVGREI